MKVEVPYITSETMEKVNKEYTRGHRFPQIIERELPAVELLARNEIHSAGKKDMESVFNEETVLESIEELGLKIFSWEFALYLVIHPNEFIRPSNANHLLIRAATLSIQEANRFLGLPDVDSKRTAYITANIDNWERYLEELKEIRDAYTNRAQS